MLYSNRNGWPQKWYVKLTFGFTKKRTWKRAIEMYQTLRRDNIDYLVKSNYANKLIMHTIKYKSCMYYFKICTMHYCKVSCICSQYIGLANISSWNVLALCFWGHSLQPFYYLTLATTYILMFLLMVRLHNQSDILGEIQNNITLWFFMNDDGFCKFALLNIC